MNLANNVKVRALEYGRSSAETTIAAHVWAEDAGAQCMQCLEDGAISMWLFEDGSVLRINGKRVLSYVNHKQCEDTVLAEIREKQMEARKTDDEWGVF